MIETPSQTHAYQDKRIECLTNQQCPRQHILERFPRCSTPLPSTLRIVNCLYPGYPYMTGFQLAFGSTSRSLCCSTSLGVAPMDLHTAVQDNSRRVAHTLPDFDGKCARMGMASWHITVISPSNTVGHIASYVVPNASMRRLRNRPLNGAKHRQSL